MTMYFEETGNTSMPSIVFIHGGGISGWMWQKQVEHFSDYHCIVPDLPEHGKSIDEGPLSLADCANRIADLIESRAKNRAHVVGHSLGGKVVIELLNRRPDLVDRAIVASALYRPMFLLKLIHRPFVYKLTVAMMRNKGMLSLTAKQFKFPENLDIEKLKNDFMSLTPDSLYRIYDQLYQYQKIPKNLANANVPTLVVAGEKEPRVMKQSVTDIAEALPDAKGILINRADHTYPWAEYAKFNSIIRTWISDKSIEKEFVQVLQR
ncbi:MAG: alpha/beta fold hydrolase [Desulfitobacteriaceae bacterium]